MNVSYVENSYWLSTKWLWLCDLASNCSDAMQFSVAGPLHNHDHGHMGLPPPPIPQSKSS